MCMRLARAMWVLWFERAWIWELPTVKKKYTWSKRFWNVFSLCSVGWSFRTCWKIWSKTLSYVSYVHETCQGHVSALVWKGLELGTSNSQKNIIHLTQEVLKCFSLFGIGWSFRTCWKIWSKTLGDVSYVYETCQGHVSALVWKALELGTSNSQKNIIYLTQEEVL